MNLPLVVLSHLRWDFIYQRPQHLLSRIARRHPVYFVHEARHEPGCTPRLDISVDAASGVTVLQPVSDVDAPGWTSAQWRAVGPLLQRWREDTQLGEHLAWLYTPMAMPALPGLAPELLIHDCMDQLSAFKGAPAEMPLFERDMLRKAGLVLTGGPSLYESKRRLHRNVHCLPSAVDGAHYAPAGLARNPQAAARAQALQGSLAHPRMGFFGAIDERIDLELVAAVAAARPDWQVAMVGPVVKIDPAALPQAPNLHWLGQQDYAVLPHLVAGWDVCLMPFALNEHTRFISPTKTLEYLAAQKPVVSTPIKDVVDMYSHVVRVADSPEAFVAACDAALAEDDAARGRRLRDSAATVAQYAWDATAERILALIAEALDDAQETPAAAAGGAA